MNVQTSTPPPGDPRLSTSAGAVLVVDDDPDILEIVEMVLEGNGFDVLVARGAAEGLRLLELSPVAPDVILLDLMMPGMNGTEFLAHMRETGRGRTHVVVLSGAGDAAVQAAKLGAVEYVPKPVDLDRLLATIRKFCS